MVFEITHKIAISSMNCRNARHKFLMTTKSLTILIVEHVISIVIRLNLSDICAFIQTNEQRFYGFTA